MNTRAGEFANDAVENIRELTPVDTGWLKNNWIVSIGSPTKKILGTREQARAGRLDLSAIIDTPGLLFSYKLGDGDIYIQNNVPYAQIVNAKHKTRKGFIQEGVKEAIKEHSVI